MLKLEAFCHRILHLLLIISHARMMDKSSFEIKILPQYKRVYAMCLAIIGDRHEAADAVQEAFAIVWERRNELDGLTSPEAYVRTVARNVCMRRIHSMSRLSSLEELIEFRSDAEDKSELKSELVYLRSLIDTLPVMQRRVMNLNVFGGCSNEEIAKITGESSDNVRQLLSRARKKIKELYNKKK